MQRLAIAFIVVLVLAVAARFARATPNAGAVPVSEPTAISGAPFLVAGDVDIHDFRTFLLLHGRA